LLGWMPENVPARINVGLCLASLGDQDAALGEYERAVELDPDAAIAVINLANLLIERNSRRQAHAKLAAYLFRHPANRAVLEVACGNLLAGEDFAAAAALLVRAIELEPGAADLLGWYAWVSCLGGQWEIAAEQASRAVRWDSTEPRARIALCATALHRGRNERAVEIAQGLASDGALADARVFDALCAALQTHARSQESDPWPYYVLCLACVATDRHDAARLAADEYKRRTSDAALHERVDALLAGP